MPDARAPERNPATINLYELRRDLQQIADREHCALGDVVRRACANEVERWKRREAEE